MSGGHEGNGSDCTNVKAKLIKNGFFWWNVEVATAKTPDITTGGVGGWEAKAGKGDGVTKGETEEGKHVIFFR